MEILKCWICEQPATLECDYCHKPICKAESCCKMIGGTDPGIACTTCFAILMCPQLAKWQVRVEYEGGMPRDTPSD